MFEYFKKISDKDRLYFFNRNFFTLDGLWVIKVEEQTNWDLTLNIDLEVWQELLQMAYKRILERLKLNPDFLEDLVTALSFRWTIEGWKYDIKNISRNIILINVEECPYKAVMERNPDRKGKISDICKKVCIPLYESIIIHFNSRIILRREHFMGLGDNKCDFILNYKTKEFNEEKKLSKRRIHELISEKDRLFYFETNYMDLERLWIKKTIKHLGFEKTKEIHFKVNDELYSTIFRRIRKYLNLSGESLNDLIKILSFILICEDYAHYFSIVNDKEVKLLIKKHFIEGALTNINEINKYLARFNDNAMFTAIKKAIEIHFSTFSVEIKNLNEGKSSKYDIEMLIKSLR